jgi:hypothetical protein
MSDRSPEARARDWLARLEAALAAQDSPAATALFGVRCFWRDMLAFTWNIRTCEGRDEIAAMLAATLARTAARGFAVAGPATETDGLVETAITFETVSLSNVRTQGNVVTADVAGKLTVKGVTKDIKVPVSFTHLPDKLGARVNDPKVKGDLLVLRANFAINRADFGIQAGKNTDKVAETIQLSLSIAGAAPKS